MGSVGFLLGSSSPVETPQLQQLQQQQQQQV